IDCATGSGSYPMYVSSGDLNGDGKPEIVVTNNYGNSFSLFKYQGAPTTPAICMVTVDSLSRYNIIAWDKSYYYFKGIDSFIVFREVQSNVYKQIGAVPFDSVSMFSDTVRKKYFVAPYFS